MTVTLGDLAGWTPLIAEVLGISPSRAEADARRDSFTALGGTSLQDGIRVAEGLQQPAARRRIADEPERERRRLPDLAFVVREPLDQRGHGLRQPDTAGGQDGPAAHARLAVAQQRQQIGGRRRRGRVRIPQQALILESDHPGELLFPRDDRRGRGSWGRDDRRGGRRHAAGRDQRQRSDDRE